MGFMPEGHVRHTSSDQLSCLSIGTQASLGGGLEVVWTVQPEVPT